MSRFYAIAQSGRCAGIAGALAAGLILLSAASVSAQSVTIGSASGVPPGSTVTIPVTLQTPGSPYDFAAVGLRISYDPINTPIAATAQNTPDCTVNPAIDKLGSFAFWPVGCSGNACLQVRAMIHFRPSEGSATAIPNGSQLFTCKVKVAAGAPGGAYPLIASFTEGSTDASIAIETNAVDGQITVSGSGCS